jgi:FemAB-related protein (PEP-CTERM system-associated)
MNSVVTQPSLAVRTADIAQPDEARRIDAFVRAAAAATPFHLTAWSRAVAKGCGQISHYLVAEDGEGQIGGVLPLTEVHSPLFGRALVSSGFAVDGGVLAEMRAIPAQLISAALILAARLSCPTLELRGGVMPGAGWQLDHATYLGFARDLAVDDETELLAIPRKQRAEVRRALGFNLVVETGHGPAQRDFHYDVYSQSVRNLGTPVFPKSLFAEVLDAFGDEADILTVHHEGRAIASVLSLYWRGTVMPYWGGGTYDARMWRANDLMYYALMLHARKAKGCTRFDFGAGRRRSA